MKGINITKQIVVCKNKNNNSKMNWLCSNVNITLQSQVSNKNEKLT